MRLLKSIKTIGKQKAQRIVVRIRRENPYQRALSVTILWGNGTITSYSQDALSRSELIFTILGLANNKNSRGSI